MSLPDSNEQSPAPAAGAAGGYWLRLGTLHKAVRLLLAAGVAIGLFVTSKGCTNWSYQHYPMESNLLVDSGRVLFMQHDGSLTAINITDGTVAKRLFFSQPERRLEPWQRNRENSFRDRYLALEAAGGYIVCSRGGESVTLDRATLEPVADRYDGPLSLSEPPTYGKIGIAYDGPEQPELKWNLTPEERAGLGLPPADPGDKPSPQWVFPGGFIFSLQKNRDMDSGTQDCPIAYRDRDHAWSGDVSYVSRSWFNEPDRVYITDDSIILAAYFGQVECLDRFTGRSRWLYVYPFKNYFMTTSVWDALSWPVYHTSLRRGYNRALADTTQTGTVLDDAPKKRDFKVVLDPKPTSLYWKTTLFAYLYVFPITAAVLYFVAVMFVTWRRGVGFGELVLGVAVDREPQPKALSADCAFLSFAICVFLVFSLHVSLVASLALMLASIAVWCMGLLYFCRSGEGGTVRMAIAALLMLVCALAPLALWIVPALPNMVGQLLR